MVFDSPDHLGDEDDVRESISKTLDWQHIEAHVYLKDEDGFKETDAIEFLPNGVIISGGSHVEYYPNEQIEKVKLHEEPLPDDPDWWGSFP